MLDKAIVFLQKHLNNKFKGDAAQDRVVLAKVEKDFVQLTLDAVTIILVGLEPDRMSRSADAFRGATLHGGSGPVSPELRLNLYLLFTARFEFYENALKHISKVIQYFQENPVLTRQNAPEMDPELDRLVLELQDLQAKQQNDIWNMLKVAANPSVLYRVRVVVFQQTAAVETPPVVEPQVTMGVISQ
jgi:hypothetical protein